MHSPPLSATDRTSRFYTGLLPNTSLAPVERFGWSLVAARLRLLRHAMAASPTTLRWFAFLSESCAPLGHGTHAHAMLSAMGGRSFIDTTGHTVTPEEVRGKR